MKTCTPLLVLAIWLGAAVPQVSTAQAPAKADRPNIVWIITEDMSPHFGCYGETTITTPNVDRLAAEGVRFDNAVVTGPVCSTSRSAMMTGMYQTSIGAQNHRSGRGVLKIHLPAPVVPVTRLFHEAGYLTLNVGFDEFVRSDEQLKNKRQVGVAKTDYNFEGGSAFYDRTHWAVRPAGQPFFAQVQLHGGKYRGHGTGSGWPRRVIKQLGSRTPAEAVTLPPYLPDDPVIREDWAQYLDTVRYTDWQVGRIVARLRQADELDRTYVFFITDHGISHVRNKQFCYDGGIRIPFIVRGPNLPAGTVRKDPIEHIDMAATSLARAGIAVPRWMQARDLFADDYSPRRFAFSARDRCDESVDRIRSVRGTRYKYIRNFYPQRPYLMPNRYKDDKPILQTMRRLYAQGKLNDAQAKIMAATRPAEELYDLQTDPYELHNLAENPACTDALQRMRQALDRWIARTDDKGRFPEGPMYDSDMAAYIKAMGGPDSPRGRIVVKNIAIMKQWAAQGK